LLACSFPFGYINLGVGLGAASFTFPAVALIGTVIVPIARLINELRHN